MLESKYLKSNLDGRRLFKTTDINEGIFIERAKKSRVIKSAFQNEKLGYIDGGDYICHNGHRFPIGNKSYVFSCPVCNEPFHTYRQKSRRFLDFFTHGEIVLFVVTNLNMVKDRNSLDFEFKMERIEEVVTLNLKKMACHRHYYQNKRPSTSLSGNNTFVYGDDFFDRLKNDPLISRTGLYQYLSDNNSNNNNELYQHRVYDYISNFAKNPQMEQLAKVDYLLPILSKNIKSIEHTNNASNVADILGMKKGLLKLLAGRGIFDRYAFKQIKSLHESYKSILKSDNEFILLFEIVENWSSRHAYANTFSSLIRLSRTIKEHSYNIGVKDISEYVKKCHRYQAIESANISIELWSDYLKMAGDLRLTNYEIYPRSIKLNHDLMVRNYNYHKQTINEERFNKRINELRLYEVETEHYKLVAPTSVNDIINEGKALKHCVASYIDYVIEGTSAIMFVRSKENLNKSFVTVEFNGNKANQVKGFANSKVQNAEVSRLIKKAEKLMQKDSLQISA